MVSVSKSLRYLFCHFDARSDETSGWSCVYSIVHTVYAEKLAVTYLANQSKTFVGVTLIWRKAVAVNKHNNYRPELAFIG